MTETIQQVDDSHTTPSYTGQIDIALITTRNGEITHVSITNSRPKNIGRLLIGKTPQQALMVIPKLFSLCSQAQQTAAISAISALKNKPLSTTQKTEIAERCALEWLKEHSWQLWQMERELFGENFAIKESLVLSRFLLKQLQDESPRSASRYSAPVNEFLTTLFGCKPSTFTGFSWQELLKWSEGQAPYAKLFQALQLNGVRRLGAFENWHISDEDGPLSRQSKHPLLISAVKLWGASVATRTLARLIEIVEVSINPEISLSTQQGVAFASRGTLTHKITTDSHGLISHYTIDAPTDRYFSLGGLVEKSLIGQQIPNMASKWIRQLIWAIDPCIEFTVAVNQMVTDTQKES